VIVDIYNTQSDVALSTEKLPSIVKSVLSLEGKSSDEVAIYLVDQAEICRIHEEFFQDSSPTDCISFPMDQEEDEGYHILGEVFVCPKVAMDYTHLHGGCVAEEVTLYVVHGLLHLLGYDDLSPPLKAAMRRAEKRHLTHLKTEGHLLTINC